MNGGKQARRQASKPSSQANKTEGNAHKVDGGVHDAGPVRADGARDGVDVDGVEVAGAALWGALHEDLLVKVVEVALDEDVDVAHDLQDVQPLVQRADRQVVLVQVQPVHLLGQVGHLAVPSVVVVVVVVVVVAKGVTVWAHSRTYLIVLNRGPLLVQLLFSAAVCTIVIPNDRSEQWTQR